jgi:hypothetical protein
MTEFHLKLFTAVLVVLFPLSKAKAAELFDLTCHGSLHRDHITTHTGNLAVPNDEIKGLPEPWNDVFHVDLMSGLYCEGDCRSVQPIARVDVKNIVFQSADLKYVSQINRLDGSYKEYRWGNEQYLGEGIKATRVFDQVSVSGRCVAGRITKTPRRQF